MLTRRFSQTFERPEEAGVPVGDELQEKSPSQGSAHVPHGAVRSLLNQTCLRSR